MISRRKIKRIETKKTDCRAKNILRRKIKRIETNKRLPRENDSTKKNKEN